MRLRARHIYHIEVLTDNLIGLVINYWLTFGTLTLLGLPFTHGQNAVLTAVIFVVSYIRKYTVRVWFSNWIGRIYKEREIQEQTGES